MCMPVFLKGFGIFRTNDHYLCLTVNETLIILAQLRHMRAAEGSEKTAVENQQDIGFFLKA